MAKQKYLDNAKKGGSMRGFNTGGEKMPIGALEVRTQTTFQGRLQEEKENLERRLLDVNAVLESLKNAPEVANVLEALNKLGY